MTFETFSNYKQKMVSTRVILALLICYNSFSLEGFAQTGPAGVGSNATMFSWWDASRESFANGVDVATFTDQVGSNNLTQSSATVRPTFSSSEINGRPAILFNGAGDHLFLSSATGLNSADERSYFGAVQKSASASGTRFFLDHIYSNGEGSMSIHHVNDFYRWVLRSNIEPKVVRQLEDAATDSKILSTVLNVGSSSFVTRVDGTDVGSSTYANGVTATGTTSSITMGKVSGLNQNFLDGSIGEYFIYTFDVNTTQTILIENYLSAKYTIPVAESKYAFGSTHGNEVAGIGRESVSDAHLEAQGTSIVRMRDATLLDDNDYLMWGHDNGALTTNTVDVPGSYAGTSGMRLNRVWRADEAATDVGATTVVFVMTGIGFGTDPLKYQLLTDTDGTFSNASTTGVPPTISGDSVIFENINLADNIFFTIGNTNEVDECSYVFSGNWSDLNWDCGVIPDSSKNAIIPAGSNVTITDARSANDLTIEGSLVMTASGSLVVTGDLNIAVGGSIDFDESSSLILRGNTGDQTVTNSDASATVIGNLEISNEDGVTLVNAGEIHVSSGIALTRGTLNCEETLRMLSVSGRQSAIVSIGATGGLAGSIQMDRFIASRAPSWGTFSAPITGGDFEQIDDNIFISGVTGGDGYAGGFISLWQYDEVANDYEAISNTTDAMEQARGYELWLADDMISWNDGTIDYTGTPDVTEISVSLNTSGGWNLIGNPYPAFLSWTNLSTGVTGITGDQYFIYDQATSQYVSHGDGTNIPPGQGFWVHSSVSSLVMTPTNDFANSSTSAFFKSDYISALPELEISLESVQDHYAHTAFIRPNDNAFAGYDEYDMTMLRSPDTASCEVALESSLSDLLVNYVPTNENKLVIPFHVTAGVSGTYSLKLDGIENLSQYECINILDKQLNVQVPITSSYELNLLLEKDKSQFFQLILSQAEYDDCIVSESSISKDPVEVFARDKEVVISYFLDQSTTSTVEIFDLTGTKVYTKTQQAGFNRERIPLESASAGIYLINVSFENGTTFSRKVFIQ